jgi:hypothetical protein
MLSGEPRSLLRYTETRIVPGNRLTAKAGIVVIEQCVEVIELVGLEIG